MSAHPSPPDAKRSAERPAGEKRTARLAACQRQHPRPAKPGTGVVILVTKQCKAVIEEKTKRGRLLAKKSGETAGKK